MASAASLITKLMNSLPPGSVKNVDIVSPHEILVEVDRRSISKAVEVAYWGLGGFLSTMVGVDMRPVENGFRVYYVLSIEEGVEGEKLWLTIWTRIPWNDPRYPSSTPSVPAASWYEREALDLLGLEPVNHPDPRRLVLPDDWPEGLYPLRNDYDHSFRPPPREGRYEFRPEDVVGEVTQISVGPIHPAADEPAQFRLFLDGEEIVDVDYRMFYVHRGIEKIAVSRMTYNQVPFIAERICGICGYAHSCCYCQAVEKALRVEVPERAEFIRTVMLEVERIHSHLLNLAIACHLAAFDTGFMELMRVREVAMKIAELLSGGRKTYGLNLVGGVRRDIPRDRVEKVLSMLRALRSEYREVMEIVLGNRLLSSRCEGVGVLPRDVARALSVVGPVARGSGVPRDTRYDHPYAAYGRIGVEPITESGGDVWSRLVVRAREVLQSIEIIEHALDAMPSGPIAVDEIELTPLRVGIGAVEAPRGEDVHFVITSHGPKLLRWRVRASTYNNWPALPYMARGYTLADFPLIVASIDPCYSCTERVIVVRKGGARTVLSYDHLVHLCRKRSRA